MSWVAAPIKGVITDQVWTPSHTLTSLSDVQVEFIVNLDGHDIYSYEGLCEIWGDIPLGTINSSRVMFTSRSTKVGYEANGFARALAIHLKYPDAAVGMCVYIGRGRPAKHVSRRLLAERDRLLAS